MKLNKKLMALLLTFCLTFTVTALAGCDGGTSTSADSGNSNTASTSGDTNSAGGNSGTNDSTGDESSTPSDSGDVIDETKTVKSIAVESEPDKTSYVIGDTFSLEGGTVLVTYTDGTTQTLPMTSSSFTVSTPGMSASGTKTVTIKCGSKSARFSISVANKSYTITYHYNYDVADTSETVVKGAEAVGVTPVREGYTFVAWYANIDYTYQYSFPTKDEGGVQADADLYALWKKNDATYVDVTFDYDFYGKKLVTYSYPVESGTAVTRPVVDPTREGYAFAGWLDENGDAYDFTAAITTNTTIKASWTKTTTGVNSYVFEAEYTDLTNKIGPAFSGTAQETGMIVSIENRNCSNDRFVSYLYRQGNSLEFYIVSDVEATDVTIELSLSAELRDYTYNKDNFGMYLNGVPLDYGDIVFENVPEASITADCLPFQYYTIGTNLTLKKGANLFKLVTENSVGLTGTTLEAAAPIVDALKVTTTAVVTWDENYNLPANQ